MDDSEYYRMMRNQYSHTSSITKNKSFQYTSWNAHQGREDAQMLQEKSSDWKAENSEQNNDEEN